VGVAYVIAASPAEMPETIPVDTPIVAIPVEPEVHVPPRSALLRLVPPPWHIDMVPVIAAGIVFTVTTVVVLQPVEV
jgi:hypothetical protein